MSEADGLFVRDGEDAPGAALARKIVEVRIHERRWGVFVNGAKAPESLHDRKIDAVAAARRIAAEADAEVVVYNLDGTPQ